MAGDRGRSGFHSGADDRQKEMTLSVSCCVAICRVATVNSAGRLHSDSSSTLAQRCETV